ncbi:MarR family transcriptional regulator [Halomonas sp. M4R5S39]|uniref:MarR family winged helix-turn-helix transcriptional regulator n=1 Tax=Halomonas kalidii TaxID=3043293 RepID=UPI0024A85201|nr:MarR family transcriptional regulator [Halomonas kalidii]MDI5983327.1 MarR family transcriptional regulator [Halomonas kalidii]
MLLNKTPTDAIIIDFPTPSSAPGSKFEKNLGKKEIIMSEILKALAELESDTANFDYRFKDFPFYYIASIQKRLQDNLAQSLRPHGVTPQEWRILASLNETDGLSTTEISAMTLLERSRVSRITDSMRDHDWITKQDNCTDKRFSLAFLTKNGRDKFSEILPVVCSVHKKLLHGFDESEAQLFIGFLRRVNHNALP